MARKVEQKKIVIDGVEYITKRQLAERVGYTVDGLSNRLKKCSLNPLKLKSGRILFCLKEVIEAEKRGEFIKYL